jgi:hypothetical protein
MKERLILSAILTVLTIACSGQQNAIWDKWNWLMGEWKGEGGGEPGQSGGTFSFGFDLDKKIIVRKSHSEYPATNNKPEVIHDDLMIIYPDGKQEPSKAIYFDNEGHIINYSISYENGAVILTSDKAGNAPLFRLTYTLIENNMVNTKFEMSQDGLIFIIYIEGKSKKIKFGHLE